MSHDTGSIAPDELLAHAGFLARLARELTKDEHAAADLVQETYRVALERPPRTEGTLRGWLATVLANLARNMRRSDGRRSAREEAAARAELHEPDGQALERLELQKALVELVLALPEEQRTVLYLRHYEDQKPAAIAARLGVPVATVKSRHLRAVAELRARLDARSGGERGAWAVALAGLALPRGAGVGSALVMGGAMTKKLVLVAGIVAALVVAWRGLGGELRERFAASRAERVASLEPLVPTPAEPAPVLAPAVLAERVPSPSQPLSSTTGALAARFTWSDGTPAAGIGVDVACANDPAPREELFRALTDADGVARFEELFAGPVRVYPDLRGWYDAAVAAGTTSSVAFTLEPGLDVTGRVVGPTGEPVGGATILGRAQCEDCPNERPVATSAADGSFSLRAIDGNEPLGARRDGFLASAFFRGQDMSAEPSGARSVVLTLGAGGGRVTGRVLDPDGLPVAGARVLAGPRQGHVVEVGSRRAMAAKPGPVETDAEGRFAILGNIEAGPQPIHATARGYPVVESEVEVVAGATAEVELRLQPAARVEGRVLGVDGAPAADVLVREAEEDRGGWYRLNFPGPETRTDAQGFFTLDGVAPGLRELNAHDQERPEIGRARASLTCVAGETATAELRLELGHTIEGRVEDENGAPIAGWVVRSKAGLSRWWYPRSTRSGPDGRFLLVNLGDGAHDLTVTAPDSIEQRAFAEGVPVGTTGLVLVVENANAAQGRLQGRMRDPSGHPLDDVEVTLWREGVNAGEFVEFDPATGVFEAEALPGRYRLDFQRGTKLLASRGALELEEHGLTDAGEIVFEALGRLELEIHGLPAEFLERLRFSLDRPGSSTTKLELEDGLLRSPELLAGPWTLSLSENELVLDDPTVVIVAGTTTRLVREVRPAIRVRLSFTAAGEYTVSATDAHGRELHRRTYMPSDAGSDERLCMVGLPPGHATIVVRSGGREARLELDVVPALTAAEPFALELR
jgi:RNA polymerase sigma factor (sigma-70 family)